MEASRIKWTKATKPKKAEQTLARIPVFNGQWLKHKLQLSLDTEKSQLLLKVDDTTFVAQAEDIIADAIMALFPDEASRKTLAEFKENIASG